MPHRGLSKLAARRKARPDQKIGEFIIENFFELFEYVLSYLSNSMSFLRVVGRQQRSGQQRHGGQGEQKQYKDVHQ